MRLLILALAAAAASAGCRPPSQAAPAPQTAYPGPLASSLDVATAGDSTRLVLQVTNGTDAAVVMTFPSGQTYDFIVRDGDREVWRWSTDMMFTQAVRTVSLAPGETRGYSEVWHAPAELRGRTLTAVGRLTSSDHPLERTAEFRVP